MAARALSENLSVIDLSDWREPDRRMAILAKTRRRNMQRVLTRRADAVVAACAPGIDTCVVEKHRKPASSPMTAVTLLDCRRMIGWLADRLDVVVTTRTTAKDRIVVHFCERKPGRRPMAVLAEIGAQYMVGWFRGRLIDAATSDMTAYAFGRSSLKYGTDVTTFALGVEVPAVQPESRRQVIELRVADRLGASQCW